MTLKTVTVDGKTYAEVSDGKPLYLDGDKEIAFDAPGTVATISRLNGEAKGHRERAEVAETKLKTFEGITDPAAAIKALTTIKNLDDKQLVAAGDVEKVKAEAIKAVEEKYKPIVDKADKLERELHGEKIGGAFARSKFISDKIAVPADIVQARFGSQFKLEDGKVVAFDQSGNKLFSRAKPGEVADFEEALEMLVDQYPYKDAILKGANQSGGGSKPGNGNKGGAKTITREAFEALNPIERSSKMKEGFTITEPAAA